LGVLGLVGMALTLPPFLAGLRLHESRVGVYGVTSPGSSSGSNLKSAVELPESELLSIKADSQGLLDRILKSGPGPD